MAILTGTPFSSYSVNFQPGLCVARLSYFTEIPRAFSFSLIPKATSSIWANCSSPLNIGTITTCIGASFGGKTNPKSSECDMISAPINRVDTPHDDAHAYSILPSLFVNFTSNAFAKFCPKKCEVPA